MLMLVRVLVMRLCMLQPQLLMVNTAVLMLRHEPVHVLGLVRTE